MPVKKYFLLRYFIIIIALPLFYLSAITVDTDVYLWARSLSPEIRQIAEYMTRLGESDKFLVPLFVMGFGLMAGAKYIKKRLHRVYALITYRVCLFLAFVMSVTGLENMILKFLIGRARPKFFEEHGVIYFNHFFAGYNYNSFPSGHTTTAVAFFMALIYLFPRYNMIWIFCIICAGLSRILLTAHYFTDVWAAAVISASLTYGLIHFMAHRKYLFTYSPNGYIKSRYKILNVK